MKIENGTVLIGRFFVVQDWRLENNFQVCHHCTTKYQDTIFGAKPTRATPDVIEEAFTPERRQDRHKRFYEL